jgi:hypothetical protein
VRLKPGACVGSTQRLGRISGDTDGGRHVREHAAVRSPELEHAVSASMHAIALLVHAAVVAATQQREVRQRGRAALGPVTDVMALRDADAASGKPTAAVAVLQRPP